MMGRVACIALSVWALGGAPEARAQSTAHAWPGAGQRPLATVDPLLPEPGWLVVETGAAFAHDREIPAVGLRGDALRVPELTLRLSVARRVELRVDTGYEVLFVHDQREAPLSAELDYDGEASSDIRDPGASTIDAGLLRPRGSRRPDRDHGWGDARLPAVRRELTCAPLRKRASPEGRNA